jgi:hypothetical protein
MNARLLCLLGAAFALSIQVGCDQAALPSVNPGRPAGTPGLAIVANSADPAESVDPLSNRGLIYSRDVARLIDRYCLSCHDRESAEGGVILDALAGEASNANTRTLLLQIAGVLRSESMPPEEQPRPAQEEREILQAWLDAALGASGRQSATGRVTIRRLNRTEYNNTIRDLIGLDLRPGADFPTDDVGYGFDNIAEVLATPPLLVEMELAAAESVIEAAFQSPAAWQRIMNPPADTVPLAFRKYTPPVRTPRVDKIFRTPGRRVEDPELQRQQRIYDILRAFSDRAFRRPALHDELTRLLTIVLSAEKDGEDPDTSIRLALKAVLASPQFLFRLEQVYEARSAARTDFDLASRLSYVLWSSLPDDELLQLAARGELRRGDILRNQARRMLADPRARALSENFIEQWLQIRRLDQFAPDPALFPNFDEALRSAMIRETQLFCRAIQAEDRSILDFLDADETFVNERLARHYGIAGVRGTEFRRVSLVGTARAGVLTQASILAATSNPNRTSPAKRGKWILESILDAPPAPPPSGVEALKEGSPSEAAHTLRERMERHRSDPRCASCHGRMDPLGFALENFDATGAWRTHEDGRAIDATGRLPAGRSFRGPEGLRDVLRARRDVFARCLAVKMLTYALGRGLDRPDRRAVDLIVARVARDEYRFSALVLAVVESQPFRKPSKAGEQP